MNFKHEDLPYRTLTATDKKCMIPGILECTPDGRLTFDQVVELHESAATAERSWRINEHKSNHHFDECCKEHNKYPNCIKLNGMPIWPNYAISNMTLLWSS